MAALLKALIPQAVPPACWRRIGFFNVATFAPIVRSVQSYCLELLQPAGGFRSSSSASGALASDPAAARLPDLRKFYRNAGIRSDRLNNVFKEHPGVVGIAYNEERFNRIMDILRTVAKDDATVRKLICGAPEIFWLEPAKLKGTIACLGSLGITNRSLARCPQVLTAVDLDKRIKFLCAQGLSKKVLCTVISTKWPGILFEDMGVLKTRITALNEVAITHRNLQRMVVKYPWFLRAENTTLDKYLPLFKEHGLQGLLRLAQLLSWAPGLVKTAQTISDREAILHRAGLTKGSRNYLSALSIALNVRADTVEERIERYCGYGFSIDEVREMFIKQPRIIMVSDSFLDLKMRFLQRVAKVPRQNFLTSPTYVLYSLEKRLKPRFKAIATALNEGLAKHEVAWKSVFYNTDSEFARLSLYAAGTPVPKRSSKKKMTPGDVAVSDNKKPMKKKNSTLLGKKLVVN